MTSRDMFLEQRSDDCIPAVWTITFAAIWFAAIVIFAALLFGLVWLTAFVINFILSSVGIAVP